MSVQTYVDQKNDAKLVPGTAEGHIVAGTSWFLVGLLYIIAAHHRYYSCLRTSTKFVSSVDIPFGFLPGRLKYWPITAILKVLLGGSFLSMELITPMLREPGGNETPFWQHDTMAATYILSGIVDIFSIRDARRRVKTGKDYLIPEGFDYVVFAAAFGIQAQSLLSHLHGRTPLDVRVHQFHATLSVMSFIAVVVEALSMHHPFTPVIRGYMIMTQGTWLFNIVLYHPGRKERVYDLYQDSSVAMVSLQFVWHMIFNMALVLAINIVFAYKYAKQDHNPTSILENDHHKHCWRKVARQNKWTVLTDSKDDSREWETFVDDDTQSENEFEMMEPIKWSDS